MPRTIFERRPPHATAVDHALAGSKHGAVWFDDIERPHHPALWGEVEADLVIVGGGYTGLWTAVQAKERDPDATVVLLEGARIGWAASGRNGGFCSVSLTHGRENGESRWPEEYAKLDELGRRNLDGLASDVERHKMDVDLEDTGAIRLAIEPHQVDWLRSRPRSEDLVFLDTEQVRAEVASPTYEAGYWERRGNMLVHPAKLATELARVAAELGVRLYEQSVVHAIEDTGDRVVVTTASGRVRARSAVLGTNAFPPLLLRNRLMTIPVYDYALATEPLRPEQLAEIGWQNRQGLTDLANQFHYYRLTADNRIVFGGYDAVYHFGGVVRGRYEERPSSYRTLASHFLTTFPQLEGIRFTHRWAGPIDTCTRFCAFFGTARGGKVAYANGFTGLGVSATRFAGNVMLDLLSGEPTELTELRMVRERPLPFPPEPVASVGIQAMRWSLDRADHHGGRRNLLLRTMDRLGLGFAS
ncbi:FAD-binding oxidoreductase [Saccharopolyspora shandongensis]|uniref:NAD(P)/FAD-dependent oxidoreductase n=1 Tax=Saccharopolyspora shandongensis TaxID=418495 RepID=UPI003440429D